MPIRPYSVGARHLVDGAVLVDQDTVLAADDDRLALRGRLPMDTGALLAAGDLLAVLVQHDDADALLLGAERGDQLAVASWMATPWCGAADVYVSVFGFVLAEVLGIEDRDHAGAVGEKDGPARVPDHVARLARLRTRHR